MPDDHLSEAELLAARLTVVAAMGAAGKAENVPEWERRVSTMIPTISAMLGERSEAMVRAHKMATATVFSAAYKGQEFEASSQRIVVMLEHRVDNDHPDGVQRIRTERTDGPAGKAMRARLENVREGNTLLCWKIVEPMASNPNRKVSNLMHFIVLPDRTDKATDEATGGPPRRAEEPAGSPQPAGSSNSTVEDTLAEWRRLLVEPHKSNAAARLKTQGLWPVTAENLDRALVIFTEEYAAQRITEEFGATSES